MKHSKGENEMYAGIYLHGDNKVNILGVWRRQGDWVGRQCMRWEVKES